MLPEVWEPGVPVTWGNVNPNYTLPEIPVQKVRRLVPRLQVRVQGAAYEQHRGGLRCPMLSEGDLLALVGFLSLLLGVGIGFWGRR